jgi:hypothetical protein
MLRTLQGLLAVVVMTMVLGCGRADAPQGESGEGERDPGATPWRAAAPWYQPALAADSVPAAYLAAWREAPNRESCALIAFAEHGEPRARARPARFSGGWGVAFDTPTERSAFGVAGTGTDANAPDMYADWPYGQAWADGSSAGYGPEGGTGPNHLAYLRIAGQRCLYNVWSRGTREHLEELLSQLRFVDMPSGGS